MSNDSSSVCLKVGIGCAAVDYKIMGLPYGEKTDYLYIHTLDTNFCVFHGAFKLYITISRITHLTFNPSLTLLF